MIVFAVVPEALDAGARRRLERRGWSTGPGRVVPDESLVGRALVRRLLAGWTGSSLDDVRVRAAPGTRPHAVMPDGREGPYFSLSHSGGRVAVAVTGGSVIGIDLEAPEPFDPRLPARVFAPPDADRVLRLPAGAREREFARLWTVAEACAKATGDGLRRLLRRCGPLGAGATGAWDGGALRWAVAELGREPHAGYVCAVAAEARIAPADIAEGLVAPIDWIIGAPPGRDIPGL